MKLHDFIIKRCQELGITKSVLVNEFGLTWSTFTNIARGINIEKKTMEKLAKGLKCTMGDIQECLKESDNPLRKEAEKPEGRQLGPNKPKPAPEKKTKSKKVEVVTDPVNHPIHYVNGSVECIEAIESSMDTEAFRGYCKGCILKYVWRYPLKNGVEDLKKAHWYLDALIKSLEKKEV